MSRRDSFSVTNKGSVEEQFNAHEINIHNPHFKNLILDLVAPKPDPHIRRFRYRIDREPQCEALLKHLVENGHALEEGNARRPLFIIASGTREDLPEVFGTTLVEFASRNLINRFGWKEFATPKDPVCTLWPTKLSDSEAIWNHVGQTFFDLRALESPEAVRRVLSNRPSSIGFGYRFDIDLWAQHGPVLRNWIDSFAKCIAPPNTLVLAIVVLNTGIAKRSALQKIVNQLIAAYRNCSHVLVLPPLGPVSANDLEKWRQELFDEAGDRLDIGILETLVVKLFPREVEQRPIGELWDEILQCIQNAWMR